MGQAFFSIEHFRLLEEWHGEKYQKSIPEHQQVYEQLKQAYDITKAWAQELQNRRFADGYLKINRSPISQGQVFLGYNWAKIYPAKNSPKGLAFTVGIDIKFGFIVKIDTVSADFQLRQKYEQIRGEPSASPIIATMTAEQGLALDLDALVNWSVAAINNFKLSYDEVVAQLGLSKEHDIQAMLAHFQRNEDFAKFQPKWEAKTTELFIRLAYAVNDLGLDWWSTKARNFQLRCGRKEKTALRGSTRIGKFALQENGIRLDWHAFADLDEQSSIELTEELVQKIEKADQEIWAKKYPAPNERPAFWPDDYPSEEAEMEANKPIEKPRHNPENTIFYGPPGTGKTFALQERVKKYGEHCAFVTFHQSYGYEDFIEGLRPVVGTGNANADNKGEIRYEIKQGAFVKLCEKARKNPTLQFAMVIDEVNRGNISKIFGELITLIEIDKRAGAMHPASVILPYSRKSFSVPTNVDILGSMNTADRSLAMMDTALRRRFDFVEYMPKPEELNDVVVQYEGHEIGIEQLLRTLNDRIEALYDRDHTLGHAYFMPLKNIKENQFAALQSIFKNKIIPLLQEYFFDDWQKIRLILGDNQKNNPELEFVRESKLEAELAKLFGRNHGLEQYEERSSYTLNSKALDRAAAYIGIYDPKSN